MITTAFDFIVERVDNIDNKDGYYFHEWFNDANYKLNELKEQEKSFYKRQDIFDTCKNKQAELLSLKLQLSTMDVNSPEFDTVLNEIARLTDLKSEFTEEDLMTMKDGISHGKAQLEYYIELMTKREKMMIDSCLRHNFNDIRLKFHHKIVNEILNRRSHSAILRAIYEVTGIRYSENTIDNYLYGGIEHSPYKFKILFYTNAKAIAKVLGIEI